MSQRSLETLTALRNRTLAKVVAHPIRVLDNTCQPYERIAERVQVLRSGKSQSGRGGGKHRTKEELEQVKENIPAGIAEWVSRLVKDIEDGKRVVVVMGSKKRGLQLEERVLKPRFAETALKERAAHILQRFFHWLVWRKRHPLKPEWREAEERRVAAELATKREGYAKLVKETGGTESDDGFKGYVARAARLAAKKKEPLDPKVPHLWRRLPYIKSSLSRFLHTKLPPAFRYRFYHADSDPTQKEKDLLNVNVSWSRLSLLMYSPTITVGINYDPKRAVLGEDGKPLVDDAGKVVEEDDESKWFDALYIYGTRNGATPRDLFQASLRVRKLKENRCVFVLDHCGHAPPVMGMKSIRRFYEAQAAARAGAIAAVDAEQRRLTRTEVEQGWTMFRSTTVRSVPIPPWFPPLFLRNINESNVAQGFPEQVYLEFLKRCGYTTVSAPTLSLEDIEMDPLDPSRSYHDVPDISESEKNRIRKALEDGKTPVSSEERAACLKFAFKMRCGLPTEFQWLPVGVAGPLREEDTWELEQAEWSVPPWATPENSDLLWRGPYQPACPDDCAEEHKHKLTPSGGEGGFIGDRSVFYNVALEKVQPAAKGGAIAAYDDLKDRCGSSHEHALLAYKGNAVKLRVIRLLLVVLGLRDSCETKSWTPDEWARLSRALSAEQSWDFIPDEARFADVRVSSLRDLVSFVFGLSTQRTKEVGHFKAHGELERTRSDVSRILEAWSGSSIEFEFAKTEDGSFKFKRQAADASTPTTPGLKGWNEFQKAKRAELLADKEVMASLSHLSPKQQTPELTKRISELWKEQNEASGAKAKVNQRVIEGVRLVPFEGAVWSPPGEGAKVGEPVAAGAGGTSRPASLLWLAVQPRQAARAMAGEDVGAEFLDIE